MSVGHPARLPALFAGSAQLALAEHPVEANCEAVTGYPHCWAASIIALFFVLFAACHIRYIPGQETNKLHH